ncbi:MAG: alpha/beta fold hydrolase [Hyphomicrobiales bacterium]|nr:MAG: alpha/beta fold hydrolase [Hyphomicrobiales bacterium]
MPSFLSDGIAIAYEVHGEGLPILCIHGFGSSGKVNWIDTGWVEALGEAGYQPITFDNRGHGASRKLYDTKLYFAHAMAKDARNLLDHLGIEKAPVLGYSMGARIAAFLALNHPGKVTASVWGGMGTNLITGLADSETIISALTAESLDQVTDRVGRQFRIFADHNKADKAALAACMVSSREPMTEADVRRIAGPVLVATGANDDMAGPAEALATMLPQGEAFTIERRDHLRATGDPTFKRAAIDFLARHR